MAPNKLKMQMKNNLFDMIGKRISDAINEGTISPADAGRMILSANLDESVSSDDEKQYISNLIKGTNISGY